MGLPLTVYRVVSALSGREDDRQPVPLQRRPQGKVVWLHAPRAEDVAAAEEVIALLADRSPDLWFLLTGLGPVPETLPTQSLFQRPPSENRADVVEFFRKWQPSAGVWFGGVLRPELIAESRAAGVPLLFQDTGNAVEAARRLSVPGLTRATLRQFGWIVAGDAVTANALHRAGASMNRLETHGVLERGTVALPCLESERDALAITLAARPVWLAAGISVDELDLILSAHQMVVRRSHRLLLILAPENPEDGAEIAQRIADLGLIQARRSDGEEPDAETQVYLADTSGELGLWYRLAPVSFIGGSIGRATGQGVNPLDAAALGSAVVHGPNTSQFADAFRRLDRASAAKTVSNVRELADTVDLLQAPDIAAELAGNAWKVCSAGAEVAENLVAKLAEAVDADRARS